MKTLAVAKQHRLKHSNAIDSGEEKLMGVDWETKTGELIFTI